MTTEPEAKKRRRRRRKSKPPLSIDRRPPELIAADLLVEATEEAHNAALAERNELAVKVVNENLPSGRGPFIDYDLSFEYAHACNNSPLGHCVYVLGDDPCCDDCIYCGGPLERK